MFFLQKCLIILPFHILTTQKYGQKEKTGNKILEAVEKHTGRNIATNKLRDKAILTLLFGTGIRVSELVGIDLSDIDFFNASIVVTRKGGDQDVVYFGSEVEEALQDYIQNE